MRSVAVQLNGENGQQELAIISNETRLQKLIITRIVAHLLLVHPSLGSNSAHW